MRYLCLFVLVISCVNAKAKGGVFPPYVSVELEGQFGNQLFQIATAYAYSLDYQLPLTIPDLKGKQRYNIPYNAKTIFLPKIASYDPACPPDLVWREPDFNYHKIGYSQKIFLQGWFQSEKYFKHRRKAILDLFAPPDWLRDKIFAKYQFLDTNNLIVAIQIRDYRKEMPTEEYHPTIKREYYQKAMSHFSENTTFLVSSNNINFAKECVDGNGKKVIYLQGDSDLEEFYTLVLLCDSFIISNSSFGWWASWLSTAPGKTIIAPNPWFAPPYDNNKMVKDLLPEDYLVIDLGG